MDFDIKIINGGVFDGSGNEAEQADIGIRGDRIETLGNLADAEAKYTIDATGCIVCPGFIDAHSHSDAYLFIEPGAASKVYQGITTEICGNCGASAAPLLGNYRMPSDWREKKYSKPWETVAEYRERFVEARPAVNAGLLIGHNTLHAGICGYEPRGANSRELKMMLRTLEQALDDGAMGLSSGLIYPPGSAVPREEIIELAKVVARHGGTYATHMRSESDRLLEAIDEAIDIAERSGVRLQISHLKAAGSNNWNKIPQALGKIETKLPTLGIGADRYPYTAASTDLDIVLPCWASHGGHGAVLARLRDPVIREKIRNELLTTPPEYWNRVMIGSTQFEEFKGRFLPEIAKLLNTDPVDALLYLIDKDDLKTGGIFFGMSEKNLWQVLAAPYVSIGSDASLRAPWGPLSHDHPHPRAYGSHTRFLRAALDGRTVPLPEAIRKMTALPAEQFNLKQRGRINEGYFADIAVFDPGTVRETTTYAHPHRLSEGLRYLVVNGSLTLENGKLTGRRAGRFLTH